MRRGASASIETGAWRRGSRTCRRPDTIAPAIASATTRGSSSGDSPARSSRRTDAAVGPYPRTSSIICVATGPISTSVVPTSVPFSSARSPAVSWFTPALVAQ